MRYGLTGSAWRESLTIAIATLLIATGLTKTSFSDDPSEESFREKMRERLEKLSPEERGRVLQQQRRFAMRALERQAKAELPKRIDTLAANSVPGRTSLPLTDAPNNQSDVDVATLNSLLRKSGMPASQLVNDDVFVRRVYLDIIGQLPSPADIQDYLADRSPGKKAKLIDRLLALPQYGRHWGQYWSDVVRYRASNPQFTRYSAFGEVEWLAEQLNTNRPWSEIVTDILTAEGLSDEVPAGFFIASHDGQAVELAGEAARIFLGTQVACAQCHDHPYDPWKRDQFHELASFFGKTSFRPRRDLAMQRGVPFLFEVGPVLRPGQEHRKPDLEDPSKPGTVMPPIFLTGQALPLATSDEQRRSSLAGLLTSPKNSAFAKAFVNRMWNELVGFGFVEPIDDLGPKRETKYPEAFDALSASFAATDYDVKQLVRTIVLSSAYDRKLSPSESESDGPSRKPTRLSAPEIFANLDWVLGNLDDGRPNLPRRPNNRGQFEKIFGVDPSTPAQDIEGSIPQALLLMNHPLIEQRINAESSGTLLKKLLDTNHDDRAIVQMLYLRTLGRQPTKSEFSMCMGHVKNSQKRTDGFEDILWALLNSSEFIHQH